jgi:S-adenosylmethionine hydrolase
MKGVILQRSDARLVDVAHDFPRQDVRSAAFWLREVLPWFPPAVHLVVVDPGVGTDRAAIVVRAGDHAIVAPDNGVAIPAARRLADEFEVFEIAYDDGSLPSATFHGRDVFAPAAADVHETGVDSLEDIDRLEPGDGVVDLRFPDPDLGDDAPTGEVLVVDDFGNAITNIPGAVLDPAMSGTVAVNGEQVPAAPTFAAVPEGEQLLTVGSHGNVELDVNRGRGDEAFGVDVGDRVELEW